MLLLVMLLESALEAGRTVAVRPLRPLAGTALILVSMVVHAAPTSARMLSVVTSVRRPILIVFRRFSAMSS